MAQVPARLARVLSAPAAVHLGEISFGFYIYQAPLYRLWQVVSPLGPTTSLASFLAYLLTLLLVAHGSHVWVEQPLRRWLLRPPPVRGLVAGPASSEVLSAGVAKPDQGACR
ncbi:MAG: hypothetical protein Q8Q73_03055, partial [Stagnimonas sp.]|nr:hypothetical protein [Stagnimonas sp.]